MRFLSRLKRLAFFRGRSNGPIVNKPTSRRFRPTIEDILEERLVLAASFIEVAAPGLVPVQFSASAWGDYDNDGRLDILLTGRDASNVAVAKVYRNTGTGFIDIGASLTGVFNSTVAWGDYDNDGRLDILIAGQNNSLTPVTKIYRNLGTGVFSDIGASLTGIFHGALAWADYDNDGKLDIALTGNDASLNPVTKIYHNDGSGVFTENTGAGLLSLGNSSLSWGDYNHDGKVDIVLSGQNATTSVTKLYQNQGNGTFSEVNFPFTGVSSGSVAFGDYTSDQNLDILLSGLDNSNTPRIRGYYNLTNGNFLHISDTSTGLNGVSRSSVAWGDFDNDGSLDFVMAGEDASGTPIAVVKRKNSNHDFPEISAGLTGVRNGSVAWGDFDNDGKLDILLSGQDASNNPVAKIYRNNTTLVNDAPSIPTQLTSVVNPDLSVTFTWRVSDDISSRDFDSLSYNLRVGTTPGGGDVFSTMSNGSTGLRSIPARGPIQPNRSAQGLTTSFTLTGLKPATNYYWSVQAVDPGFLGSAFAAEEKFSTQFTEFGTAGMLSVLQSSAAWGDYDNDGRLDALVTGQISTVSYTKLYHNEGSGRFVEVSAGLPDSSAGSVAWGDFDNDGKLDILLFGQGNGFTTVGKVFRNMGGGSFVDISANIDAASSTAVAWADYDNDGKLDILVTGSNLSSTPIAKLYHNQGNGTFSLVSTPFAGVQFSAVAWADYDNDGKLDLLITGANSTFSPLTKLYRNLGSGSFVEVCAGFAAVRQGSVAWGDYDNDGRLDLLLTGDVSTLTPATKLYRNLGSGSFVEVCAGLADVSKSSVAWGDYDNDGRLDILLTGELVGTGRGVSKVYRNLGSGVFSEFSTGLTGIGIGSAVWGDFDNDGRLDILLSGQDGSTNQPITKLYRNTATTPNTPPPAPTSLNSTFSSPNSINFTWTGPIGDATPVAGLSYNLRIGTTPGGSDVFSNMASSPDGLRRIAAHGPIQGTNFTLTGINTALTYFWSVQAVDTTLAGGAFASEQVFSLDTIRPTAAFSPPTTNITGAGNVTYNLTVTDTNFDPSTLTIGDLSLIRTGSANGTIELGGSGYNRTVTITGITGDGSLAVLLANGSIQDFAGNLLANNITGASFIVDNTSPAPALGSPTPNITTAGNVTFTLDVTDENFDAASLTLGDLSLVRTGSANGTLGISGSGSNRTVTLSGITGDGSLAVQLANGSIQDLAGNVLASNVTSASFIVDNTKPTAAFGTGSPDPAFLGSNITFNLTVTDANFDASSLTLGDLSLVTTGNANGTIGLSGNGLNRIVTISNLSGDGTIAVRLANGSIQDLVGNVLAAAVTSGNVSIDTVNDAPVNSVPGNQTVVAGSSILFSKANSNAITITDPDARTGNVTVSLGVTGGTLAVAINYNVSLTGYSTSNLTLTGTLQNVNKTLDTLFYQAYTSTGSPIAPGNITLTVNTNDNGNNGSGGPKSDIDTLTLRVESSASHVNVTPTANVPAGNQTITPATPFAFSYVAGNAISISDIDAGYGIVQLTLIATQGRIILGTTTGLSSVTGNNSGTVVIRGRVDHINFNLQNLTYTSFNSFNGADTLTVKIEDLGASGTGGNKSDTKTINLVGTPLPANQAPINSVPGAQVAVATKALLFSAANGNAITISDPDAGNRTVSVNLKVSVGTLAIAIAFGNVTYTGYGTNNLTLTGSIDNLNKSLGTLFFQATAAVGPDTLTITTNDLENFGSGGAKTDIDTVAIEVQSLATHINAAPTITAPLGTQNATLNTPFAFNTVGNTIAVGDTDAGYDNVQVTLAVANGTLAVTPLSPGGPTLTGNGTKTITLVGRIDHIDYILQNLIYTPTTGYTGSDTLAITVNDQGRNGTGGAKQTNTSVNIQVN